MASHKSEKSHRFGWSLAYDMKLFKEHALFVKNSQEHNALIAFRKVDVPLLRDIHEHLKDVDFTRINRKHKSVIELLTRDEQVQKDAQAQATKVKEEHEQEHAKQEQPDDADSDADCDDDDDDDDDEDDEDAEDEDEDSSDSYNSDEALPETPPLKKRKSNRPSSSSRQPRPPSNCSSLRTGSKMIHPQKRNQQSRKENTNTKRTKKDKKNAVLMMLDRSATVSHHLAVMVITHCVRGMRVAS